VAVLLWSASAFFLLTSPFCGGSSKTALHDNRSHDAVIRVYDETGNVIETHDQAGDFREP
jgi:hypothetical protein